MRERTVCVPTLTSGTREVATMRVRSALAVVGILAVAVASTPARADWNDFRRGGYDGGRPDGGRHDGGRHDGGRHDGGDRRFDHRRFDGYGDRDGYGYGYGYGPRRFGPPPVIYAPQPFYSPPPYYFAPGY